MNTPEDLAKAVQIYDSFNNKCNLCHYGGEVNDRTDFVNAIAAALAEARTTPKPAAEVVEAWVPMVGAVGSARIRHAVRHKLQQEIHDLNAYCDLDGRWCWGYNNDYVECPEWFEVLIDRAALAAQSAREKP